MNTEYDYSLNSASNNSTNSEVKLKSGYYYNFKEKIEFDDYGVNQIVDSVATKNSFKQFPSELQFLLSIQKGFTVLTVGLVSTMLGIYACTANKTIEWNKKYFELKNIKTYEIPLASFGESLKYTIAEEAKKPHSNLTPPNPHTSLLFLAPVDIPNVKVFLESKTKNIPN
ncbi:hypothetical protein [Candidatus Atelocyanobacterium thalassae]|uniref:Transmembrane protein n=2 Tax=Candidatus Atelocyanobacterium thalassae TaxID=713887 RepID=A0A086CIV6_9CHRO|nr:hypothetical protein [Candidatus Atelocyanobacterium thalassa]KFF42120.1 MAG: hypothetical protein ucyna2_00184 [Candidatus Atelocyanobacterium thalassa isolate SIO64986]BDA39932.1 hypothetical protein CPARK_000077200 [cyanobacterium endosymbiont of Braarudosphaera bigelowii]